MRWIIPAALLATAIAMIAGRPFRARPQPAAPLVRFTIDPPDGMTWSPLLSFSVSPDGRRVAFVAASGSRRQLAVRSLDTLETKIIPGSDSARGPFWSPDSSRLAFFAEGQVKQVALSGGGPQVICEAGGRDASGGSWSGNNTIVFGQGGSLLRVAATGDRPQIIKQRQESESYGWPSFLPDGRHFMYVLKRAQEQSPELMVGSLDSPAVQRLGLTDTNAAFVAPGYLLFVRRRQLLVEPFDAGELSVTGEPVAIADDVAGNRQVQLGAFSASNNGVLAYRTGTVSLSRLAWFDRAGKELSSIGAPGLYQDPELSPDGRQLAVTKRDPQTAFTDIWIFDLLRGVPSRLTSNPDLDAVPVWSPDGRRIVFASVRGATRDLYQRTLDGPPVDQPLLVLEGQQSPDDWSRDGKFLLFDSMKRSRGSRRTAGSSRTCRTSRASPRFTSAPFQNRGVTGASRRTAAGSQGGAVTARNCSTWRRIGQSWRSPLRFSRRSRRACRRSCSRPESRR